MNLQKIPSPDQLSLDNLHQLIYSNTRVDEEEATESLLNNVHLSLSTRKKITQLARKLVVESRKNRDSRGNLDAFLEEFGLSNQEGVALMCLAEALLRIPDDKTKDKLIAEKIASADWAKHSGQSDSLLVNASTWGLMLTGQVIRLDREMQQDFSSWFKNLISRVGEPAVRTAMMQAMRIMGNEFVLGRTIEEAFKQGKKTDAKEMRFSFDMLGEGARTYTDAKRYLKSYTDAIHAIGKAGKNTSPYNGPGISVKLSALHPNYNFAHQNEVVTELLPDVKSLALLAKHYQLGFTIDAEEADRLDISLNLLELLANDKELADWQGLGLAVQAYQKRAMSVIDWLIALGRQSQRRFMVRLVKGAYWDSEIKHTQVLGLEDYPVYTRKVSTDVSYLVCAERMLSAPEAIFSQFATHNAHTLAAIATMSSSQDYEYQRLHGMGELLYRAAKTVISDRAPCRVYAPVGSHEDLLPYLVRRLLENGANSSFVNRFLNEGVPVDELVADPISKLESLAKKRHPHIPLPANLYGTNRKNSNGIDLTNPHFVAPLLASIELARKQQWQASPIIDGKTITGGHKISVCNPADNNHIVGHCMEASVDQIETALSSAAQAQIIWDQRGGEHRAQQLLRTADALETNRNELIALLIYEAGKTIPDAIAEVREAVDFCRYYSVLTKQQFANASILPGPTGESNELTLHGRGVFACISPWNFPLAIFIGQIAAALAAGNAVIAKPAEQTPLIAAFAVKLMHAAGIPVNVLQLLPGKGSLIGAALIADTRIAGVAFTGSTETAKAINLSLAQRDGAIVPLIAETGGQNTMIVDSTALLEQVVDDVIRSAFLSAGQRCSALRVLCVQEEVADALIEKLCDAIDKLTLGDPALLSTDCGPIIDAAATTVLQKHLARMQQEASVLKVYQFKKVLENSSFFAPAIIEIKSLSQLQREVFGPLLHILRYKEDKLTNLIQEINKTGYGLTLGIHSRIEKTANTIFKQSLTGNTYINRDMVGAVVGVQPFGGQNLSGTGPKAGGPHYLLRFANERTRTVNTTATGGNTSLFTLDENS